jgi:hypothetical protein
MGVLHVANSDSVLINMSNPGLPRREDPSH